MGGFRTKVTGTLNAADEAVTAEYRFLTNGACGVQLTGDLSGTLVIEVTLDGTNWVAFALIVCATGATATTITANGIYRTELVGAGQVRVRCSAYTSGDGAVTMYVADG